MAAGCSCPSRMSTAAAVSTPVDFAQQHPAAGSVPEMGQHTEEVLLELGYDWDRIIELKEAGAVY
jgi:crotonobetainyl-CoA:carnitine CoA-transferase CaiB-like acyl-CoA transferase